MSLNVCTSTNKKPYGSKLSWKHPDMIVVAKLEDEYGNTYDIYECPNCGYTRKVETVD